MFLGSLNSILVYYFKFTDENISLLLLFWLLLFSVRKSLLNLLECQLFASYAKSVLDIYKR